MIKKDTSGQIFFANGGFFSRGGRSFKSKPLATVALNISPDVSAGADQSITSPTSSVTLSGTASDPDGTIASYLWSKVTGGTATITSPSSASTTVTGLGVGNYTFRLTVTDNLGATDFDEVNIVVNSSSSTYGRQNIDTFSYNATGGTAPGLTWLPTTYATDGPSVTYPLIVFLHGAGESSSTANYALLCNTGLPQLIKDGFDPVAVNPVDSQTYKFIVCSPQHPWWSFGNYFADLTYILADIKARYRVDATRVYFTGLSAGAQGSVSAVTNTQSFAQQVAAIVPMSFSGWNQTTEETESPKIGGTYGVKMWSISGQNDSWLYRAQNLTNYYNNATPAPSTSATLSVINNVGHDSGAWNTAYAASWKTNQYNSLGLSIYEWMLQYHR